MQQVSGRKRVLIVEDDVDTLVAFGKALTLFGVDGIPVCSCKDARATVMTVGGVHAVVADLHLADGNGVELAGDIRRAFACRVAIMSGDPAPVGGLPAGIDFWLQKPVGLPRLREVVEALTLDRRSA
jgi:DNA-binding response OmpR family regulator